MIACIGQQFFPAVLLFGFALTATVGSAQGQQKTTAQLTNNERPRHARSGAIHRNTRLTRSSPPTLPRHDQYPLMAGWPFLHSLKHWHELDLEILALGLFGLSPGRNQGDRRQEFLIPNPE